MPQNSTKGKGGQVNKTQIQKTIKEEKGQGITGCAIHCILANVPNFLGCFAQDEIKSLTIYSLPVYLIVNFDHSFSSGTHWIALRISKHGLEIFDPLGFNTQRWPNIPHFLLDFLHKFSVHRRIYISQEIQPYTSTLCGFYCIFFVIYRISHTFSNCNNFFSPKLYKNDKILTNFFNKL